MAQNAAQKTVPGPKPGSDVACTEDRKRLGGKNSYEIWWKQD